MHLPAGALCAADGRVAGDTLVGVCADNCYVSFLAFDRDSASSTPWLSRQTSIPSQTPPLHRPAKLGKQAVITETQCHFQ